MSKVADILPASPVQKGLLYNSRHTAPDNNRNISQVSFDLKGPLEPADLHKAAELLLGRYPHLCARFVTNELASPLLVIPRQYRLAWQTIDLSLLEGYAKVEEGFRKIAESELLARFDPSKSPLLRFVLVRLGSDRHRLIFTYHHLLLDGWSVPIFQRGLFALYDSGGVFS